MAIGNRQIGWSQESNLLWNISSQIQRLISVVSKSLAPKYKVYTALLEQRGGSSIGTLSIGDAVDVGITYNLDFILGPEPIDWDFTNIGGPKYPDNFPFVATINGEPNNWGGVNLTFDTGAPVATVLENTIGNIWFTYEDVGYYRMNSNTLFTDGKTAASIGVPMFIESPDDIYSSGVFINTEENLGISSYYNYNVADYALNYSGGQWIEIRVYN